MPQIDLIKQMPLKILIQRKYTMLMMILIALSGSAQQRSDGPRILFVGNSFTYFFNLPQVVSSMAETQGIELITRQSTVGGSSLEEHWKEERGTQTMRLLKEQQWDYVVFNNHSLSAIDSPESFFEYGRKFAEMVKEKGATPVFMMTWGYKSNPLLIRRISEAYKLLASETGSEYVPAGELIAESRSWRPDLELYQDDKHPSSNGTYLLGLAFYKFFTGMSTQDIPKRLTTHDEDGELLYLIFMSQEDADFLQQLVDEFEYKVLGGG